MSRKIKYRVWDNENKSYNDPYSYAYYALTQDGGLDFYCHGDHMDEADPDVYLVEQYTGLKDKNGKEIYEGDIVKLGEDSYEVLFDSYGQFCIENKKLHWTKDCFSFNSVGVWDSKRDGLLVEVIGNIHENPELLEEE